MFAVRFEIPPLRQIDLATELSVKSVRTIIVNVTSVAYRRKTNDNRSIRVTTLKRVAVNTHYPVRRVPPDFDSHPSALIAVNEN